MIVVVGGISTDLLARMAALPGPAQSIEGDVFQESPGGRGANQAIAAARLGVAAALVGRVGDDVRARQALARLAAEGVETYTVVRDRVAATGVVIFLLDRRGQQQVVTVWGANHRVRPADVEAARPVFADARVVVVGLEVPLPAVEHAVRLAREVGARVILDPAPPQPLDDSLLDLVDVIKANAIEAEVLTGIAVRDRASARRAARELMRRGVAAVAVQAGSEGNLMLWEDREVFVPALPVRPVDTIGAGDAFAGALAVAIAEGRSLEDAAWFASAAAALTTTGFGAVASLPRRDALEGFLARTAGQQERNRDAA
jgi:ribokinase